MMWLSVDPDQTEQSDTMFAQTCLSENKGSLWSYLSTFRNFHGGDSVRNKLLGHFLYGLAHGENHIKFQWGRLFKLKEA